MNDPAQTDSSQTNSNSNKVFGQMMTGFGVGSTQVPAPTPILTPADDLADLIAQTAPSPQVTPSGQIATSNQQDLSPDAIATDNIASIDISDSEKLDILDQVIAQVEKSGDPTAAQATVQIADQNLDQAADQVVGHGGSVIDQVWSQAVQASDPLNPPQASHASAKEKLASASSLDQDSPDSSTGIQYVEQEKVPEIPVEVESYLQKVEDNADDQPHEIVIADGTTEVAGTAYPSRPVIILPITQAMEDEGEKKSPKFSLRWLVEWSQKIIKIFAGKVIYREA